MSGTPLYSRAKGANDIVAERLLEQLGLQQPEYSMGVMGCVCSRPGHFLRVQRTGMSSGKPYNFYSRPRLTGRDADPFEDIEVWYEDDATLEKISTVADLLD